MSQFTPQPSTCLKYVSGLTIQIHVVSPVDDNKNNNSGLALGILSVRSFPDVSQLIVFSDPVLIMWVPCQEKVLKWASDQECLPQTVFFAHFATFQNANKRKELLTVLSYNKWKKNGLWFKHYPQDSSLEGDRNAAEKPCRLAFF